MKRIFSLLLLSLLSLHAVTQHTALYDQGLVDEENTYIFDLHPLF
jgi:hypothetical protein